MKIYTQKMSVKVGTVPWGAKAKAATGGAICVVNRDENWDIVAIRASKVGENGIKPDTFYELDAAGEFVECTQ